MIRPATADDVAVIHTMIRETATREEAIEQAVTDEDELRSALFGSDPVAFAHLAVDDRTGEVAGYALWCLVHRTWRGVAVHIDDIRVRPESAGRGHEAALLGELAGICSERGYRHLEWWASCEDQPAVAYYESLGAEHITGQGGDVTILRLSGKALADLGAGRVRRGAADAEQPSDQHAADSLGLSPGEMRRLGYRVVDLVVDHFENKASRPVTRGQSASEVRAALQSALPEAPGDPDEAIDRLAGIVLANKQHLDHPRFFARVPGPSSFAAVLGDWMSIGYNATATSWGSGLGPSTVESVVLDWLRELVGMPEGTEGVLVSGGSLANFTAIAAARAWGGQGVAYLTDQTHSVLRRGLVALGFPPEHIRTLATDQDFRYSVDALAAAVAEDRAAGRRPLMVAATAGTTNTGVVDPLNELADFCEREGLWFHVDGAYGAPAALCDAGRAPLAGVERADSLVLDPHKWLYQPVDVGCVLVRRPGALRRAFAVDAEYLKDVTSTEGPADFRDYSLELTRRSRALKLWLTFQVYGVTRIREAIATCLASAEFAETVLRKDEETWEVVTPAQLGIVTFALRGADEAVHEERAAALLRSGYASVTTTKLKGRSVLRLCVINPLTTQADIVGTIDRLARG